MISRLAIVAALALASTPLLASTYTLESNYTQAVVRWNHLGFSSPSAQFSQGEGTLEFDAADPTKSSVTVMIPLAHMTTGVPDLDDDFRSADFFDMARFPTATFKSVKVEKGVMADQLKVIGELSLHGVTKPLTLDVSIVKIGKNPRNDLATIGFAATASLNRSDFGLGKFVPQVSDEIHLQIISQAVDAKAYAAQQKAEAEQEAAAAKTAAKK